MSDWKTCQYDQIDHIEKLFTFKKYSRAVAFANMVAALAETYGHHPRMVIEWGKVFVAWGTHQSDEGSGILPRDRALAKRCDELFEMLGRQLEIEK